MYQDTQRTTPGSRPEPYQLLFDYTPLPLMVFDMQTLSFLDVNQAAVQDYGYSHGEFLGMTVLDLRPNDDIPAFLDFLRAGKDLQGSTSSVWRHRKKNGHVIDVQVTWHPVTFNGRKAILFLAEDITARKRSHEKLREREALFRAIFDQTNLGICYADLKGRLIATNAALQTMFGFNQNEFSGMPLSDLLHPEDRRCVMDPFQELATGRLPHFRRESRCVKKNGQSLWAGLSTSVAHDLLDHPEFAIVLIEDITEQRTQGEALARSEMAVKEREARLSLLLKQMPAIVWTMDQDLRITSSTGAGLALLRMNSLVGKNLYEVLQSQDSEYLPIASHMRCLRGESVTYEYEWLGRNFRVHLEPLRENDGSISGCVGVSLDTTDFKLAQNALRESKDRYRRLVDLSPYAIMVSSEGRIVYINRAGLSLLGGVNAEQIAGKSVLDFVHPDFHVVAKERMQALGSEKDAPVTEEKFIRLDGHVIDVEVSAIPFKYQDKPAIQAVIRDITKRKKAEEALRTSEERYRAFVEHSSEAIWRCEIDPPVPVNLSEAEQIDLICRYGYLAECNDLMAQMYGYSRAEDFIGARLFDLLVRDDPANAEYLRAFVHSGYRLAEGESHEVDKFGEERFFSNNLVGIVEDGHLVRTWGIQRDITEHKESEQMIRHLAYHDSLTGLPNRMLFQDRFGQALVHSHRNKEMLAMLFLDLDRFKTINDTLGHAVGDRLLKSVAERLASCLREGDTIARLGGDEFMILLTGIRAVEDAAKVADKILTSLKPSFRTDDTDLHITTSIGISLYPFDGKDAETLIKNADVALYRAKEHGRDCYQMYTPGMNERALEKLSLENSLRTALEREEFEIHYQPQVSIRNGRIVGVEALLRWRRPSGQLLLPSDFISLAEDTGLILSLGEWTLRSACAQGRAWHDAGYRLLTMSVNVSARQLQQANLVKMVAEILGDTGFNPRCLELELTESAIMRNPEVAVEVFREMKSMGIQMSIDDFGTGYSSLSYLKSFPLSALKVDRSFVRNCMSDSDDAAIVTAIISMAHSLKLKVIAEGVETEGQLAFLKSLDCDFVQGLLYGPPQPPESLSDMLRGDFRMRFNTGTLLN
ncbi:MAG TPA: PAS domain S-box protein [Acidobacteriota bacterium]|nr:PAS domain S-box protein [Acidobacteriota bacterium]